MQRDRRGKRHLMHLARSAAMAALWALVLLVAVEPGVRAQAPNRAGIVIDYGNGLVDARCVALPDGREAISGFELLDELRRQTGLSVSIEPFPGKGNAVCRIGDTGCTTPQENCFCKCMSSECKYWSYWQQAGGVWEYSVIGSSSTEVRNGSVDGWSWSEGVIGQHAENAPRLLTFDEICNPTPTPTVTPTETPPGQPTAAPTETREPSTSTPTPIPTETWTPTPGPTPTDTSTPIATPSILHFAADRSAIAFGESVTLSWDVAGADTVLLRYPGGEEQLPAQGSKAMSPQQTMTYVLFAASAAGHSEVALTVDVAAVFSAPTADLAAAQAPLPEPSPTETWTPEPPPTATDVPTLPTTDTPLPIDTPPPAETPIPQEAAVAAVPPVTVIAPPASPLDTPVAPAQPAVVLLDPADGLPSAAGEVAPASDDRLERLVLVSGIALAFGAPLLFGGIWLVIWAMWRRR